MPLFTIKEIELHGKNSGKIPGLAIVKTLDCGKKFKEERYISADTIATSRKGEIFYIREECKANMKKEFRNMEVSLDRSTGSVTAVKCFCHASYSSYCNHIMQAIVAIATIL